MNNRGVSRHASRHVPAQETAESHEQRRKRRHGVAVVLFGSLGDQLFQWAFGEALRVRGARVVADASRCRPLQIEPLLEGWDRLPAVIGLAGAQAHRADVSSLWRGYVTEHQRHYDADLLGRAEHARYVVGGFRSLRYFAPRTDPVRARVAAFAESALTEEGRQLERLLRDQHDVAAFDVRRGYPAMANGGRQKVLPTGYYEQAWERLTAHGFRRRAWFSDDLTWVSEKLAGPDDLLVDSGMVTANAGRLALMAACRGRVLSNSSSGWWAGFLGRQPEQGGSVVAPARWFVQERLSPGDLLGAGWQLC
jgi:hypothetical protein